MQIRVGQGDKENLKRFIERFIVPRFLTTIRAKFNRRLIENYADIFNVNSFVDVFLKVNFIRVQDISSRYLIVDINPNIKLSDGTLFINCCKAINYGNLSVQSYPIFDACLKMFKKDLPIYY